MARATRTRIEPGPGDRGPAENHVVIAGAGHAGMQLADSLRSEGFTAPITLVNDEVGLPYQRPPLSKDFLAVDATPQSLPLKARGFFADNQVTLVENNPIVGIDREARSVRLSDGRTLEYSDLVFATGARNKRLTVPGADLNGVHYLRTSTDASQLRSALTTARTAVVVGAGFIGLEFAAAARAHGVAVTVLEYGDRPMARAVSEATSEHFTSAHTNDGVHLVFGESVTSLEADGSRVTAARGRDGARYPADIVAVGIGVEPNSELAAAVGLGDAAGIEVDAFLRTADPNIWAIGDCAYFPCSHAGIATRRESVQNAVDQAKTLARTLTETPSEYRASPWFWSHQGRQKLQIAGVTRQPARTVVHGDVAAGKFSVFTFTDDILTCVESVNSPGTHVAARRVLSRDRAPSAAEVEAVGFDLKALTTPAPATAGERKSRT